MRIGIQNIMETISSLGYGNAPAASAGWKYLDAAKDETGRVILSGTLTKSYLPKEKVGKPSAWATSARSASARAAACFPSAYWEEGFPHPPVMASSAA